MGSWRYVFAVVLLAALPAASGCGRPTQHESAVAELVTQADAAATPDLDWAPCADAELARYQCATARVPLDYARPDGETIDLAVLRQPATDPDRRLGTLFTAVDGPGGSGFARAAAGPLFSGPVSRRFDVVTFDQRGVGRSAGVRCFADGTERRRFWSALPIPPTTPEQRTEGERAAGALAAGCASASGALLPHLTTVDAARDLDLLRRAVGDPLLNYQGDSYASYLGIVYGALFGDRVRAMQLGALIDPESYTRDTGAALTDAALGTEEVLGEFLRLCAAAGASGCEFAGSPGDPSFTRSVTAPDVASLRARDDTLLARVSGTVGAGERAVTVTRAELIRAHVTLLRDSERGWPALARLLIELERGADGAPEAVRDILAAATPDPALLDAFTAISCADHTLPRGSGDWQALADETERTAPTFGGFWLSSRQPCAWWPAPPQGYPQRYAGPWTLGADKPALLLHNRFDPATPLPFAHRAQQAMVNARLVIVSDGYGHEPAGDCAEHLRELYLIDLRLPAPGATCAADRPPFPS